jgi:SAM-dependent methyltransferase
MMPIDLNTTADLCFTLRWRSERAEHTEIYQAQRVNFWRDILPRPLFDDLMGKTSGESVELELETGSRLTGYNSRGIFDLHREQFVPPTGGSEKRPARMGRFYPKGCLSGLAGVFPQNIEPFRCVGTGDGRLRVDFNHPLADRRLSLKTDIGTVYPKAYERGGTSEDWIEVLCQGPGMQSRWQDQPTDFFADRAFERQDEQPDEVFYRQPRLVQHIDASARQVITGIYGDLLTPNERVLDLMSSWTSHLPQELPLKRLAGLGLNAQELSENRRLTDALVQDLNQNPHLPYAEGEFDAVLCTVSVEYLVRPEAVFDQILRILVPGGRFIVTFSNRWFPSKAIGVWKHLHDFERMGLVLEYFYRSGGFDRIQTLSHRGWPRPAEDKYYPQLPLADPVYAVWGQKR